MHGFDVSLIALFVGGFALLSKRLAATPITAPMLALGFGALCGPMGLDLVHFEVDGEEVALLAEFTLALVLFHDAAGIDLGFLRRNLGLPERLLGIGLPLTIVLGWLAAWAMLGGELGGFEAALLAAILAPTDAALGQAVVSDASVPAGVRQGLNVESGLNDGLAVPVVAILLACATGDGQDGPATWIRHALVAVGYGAGVGALIGGGVSALANLADRRGALDDRGARVLLAATPLGAFFGAEALHGSGFLAAFVAGLAVAGVLKEAAHRRLDLVEDLGDVFGQVTWIAFGVAALPFALQCATIPAIAYALLSLTVLRMGPVALGLVGSGAGVAGSLFIGWFGPRGLATVVFALGILHRGDVAGAELIFGVAVWTVVLSAVLHGITAAPLARAFGARQGE